MIETTRLILRSWHEEDLEPFAQLNADARVMEYFPSILSREESEKMAKNMQAKIEEWGYGLWAAVLKENHRFIGFIGLNNLDQTSFPTHFSPTVEIGWRLAFEYWGKGYASEGAKAALQYGFEELNLSEIVAFTTIQNQRSKAVMERIGMHHDPKDDFNHPKLPENHPLSKHVLYRLKKKEWQMIRDENYLS